MRCLPAASIKPIEWWRIPRTSLCPSKCCFTEFQGGVSRNSGTKCKRKEKFYAGHASLEKMRSQYRDFRPTKTSGTDEQTAISPLVFGNSINDPKDC